MTYTTKYSRFRPWSRMTAALVALCFFNLELTVAVNGVMTLATAHAQVVEMESGELQMGTEAPSDTRGKQRRVALYVLGEDDGTRYLETLLRDEVAKQDGVRLVTGTPDPEVNIIALVSANLEDGIRALSDREHERAEMLLSQVFEKLIRYTGVVPKRLMARTLKGLGVARIMAGQMRAGQDMLRAALNIWPDQKPAEYAYSLTVKEAFKAVAEQQKQESTGGVNVITEPPGAAIALGGDVKGYATVKIENLPTGLHWVTGTLDGYVRSAAFVDVRPGETTTHRFSLQPRPNRNAYDGVMQTLGKSFTKKAKVSTALEGLTALIGADECIVVKVRSAQGSYTLKGWYKSASGLKSIQKRVTRDSNFLNAIQTFASDTLGTTPKPAAAELALDMPPKSSGMVDSDTEEETLIIDPNDPILKTKQAATGESVINKWWFWTIVGVATAGLATGIGFAVSSDSGPTGPVGDVTIQFNQID